MSALAGIEKFTIHKIIWNPSDHAPISVNFALNLVKNGCDVLASADLLSEPAVGQSQKAKKINSSHVDWYSFYSLIESDMDYYKYHIDSLNQSKSVNQLIT